MLEDGFVSEKRDDAIGTHCVHEEVAVDLGVVLLHLLLHLGQSRLLLSRVDLFILRGILGGVIHS